MSRPRIANVGRGIAVWLLVAGAFFRPVVADAQNVDRNGDGTEDEMEADVACESLARREPRESCDQIAAAVIRDDAQALALHSDPRGVVFRGRRLRGRRGLIAFLTRHGGVRQLLDYVPGGPPASRRVTVRDRSDERPAIVQVFNRLDSCGWRWGLVLHRSSSGAWQLAAIERMDFACY